MPPISWTMPSYDLKAIHRNAGFIEDMRSNLVQLGFVLQQIDHEDACGQYENQLPL